MLLLLLLVSHFNHTQTIVTLLLLLLLKLECLLLHLSCFLSGWRHNENAAAAAAASEQKPLSHGRRLDARGARTTRTRDTQSARTHITRCC